MWTERLSAGFLITLGVLLIRRANTVATILKKFYLQYPLVRYAGDKQLTAREGFFVAFGVVLILIGSVVIVWSAF